MLTLLSRISFEVHIKTFFLVISFFENLILSKLCMNANVAKKLIFHDKKYEPKGQIFNYIEGYIRSLLCLKK